MAVKLKVLRFKHDTVRIPAACNEGSDESEHPWTGIPSRRNRCGQIRAGAPRVPAGDRAAPAAHGGPERPLRAGPGLPDALEFPAVRAGDVFRVLGGVQEAPKIPWFK